MRAAPQNSGLRTHLELLIYRPLSVPLAPQIGPVKVYRYQMQLIVAQDYFLSHAVWPTLNAGQFKA